jgi:lysophospholipase
LTPRIYEIKLLTYSAAFLGLVELSTQQNFSASYAPVYVGCPSNVEWNRPANGLSAAEANWVAGRKKVALDALNGYLERLGMADFDYCTYVEKLKASNYANVPTLGLAISGGGYACKGMVR